MSSPDANPRAIDRSSPMPLYRQIKDLLIQEIQDERHTDSDGKSLTERALMERFHVSRAPIRQALKELSDDGFLYRRRAKGTFPVRGLRLTPPVLRLGGLSHYLKEQGIESVSKIRTSRAAPPEDVARKLGSSDEVFRSTRIISVSGEPLILADVYLRVPPSFNPTPAELEAAGSVFDLLDLDPELAATRGDHTVYASTADAVQAESLDIAVGDPVLIMETLIYAQDGQLRGYRHLTHRAEDYKLVFSATR